MSTLKTNTLKPLDESVSVDVALLATTQSLRSDLATQNDSAKGAALVSYRNRDLHKRAEDTLNVRDFDTTGGTNWDAAFVAANAAAAARGSRVFVPAVAGGYTVGNLVLTADFYSDGATLIRRAGTTGNWLTIGDDGISLHGFDFDGGWVAGRCIEIEGFADCTVKDNTFRQIGEWCVHFNGADRLKITGNRVLSASQGFGNVMPFDSAAEQTSRTVEITGNTIESIFGTAIYLAGQLSSGDPNFFKDNLLLADVVVSGNQIRNVDGFGIIGQARCLSIMNNNLRDCGNAAGRQSIVPQGVQVTVVGNTIEGGAGVGIDMGWVTTGTVSGNTIVACGQIGIEANSCVGLSITGNTITDCGALDSSNASSGISIAEGFFGPANRSSAVTVSGNVVRANVSGGRYGISIGPNVQSLIVTGNHLILGGTVAPIFVDPSAKALIYGNLENSGEEGALVNRASAGVVPKLESRSLSGNSDLILAPTGAGRLRVDQYFGTAAVPANFSAQSYLPFKDRDGNVFYIPARTTAW